MSYLTDITSVLFEHFKCSNIEELINIMKTQELATVKNLRTREIGISTKRHVKRLTFGKDIVDKLTRPVEQIITGFTDYKYMYSDIIVEPSHGDILFYDGESIGRHSMHIDEVPKKSPGSDYVYNSFILCLSSDVSHSDDGTTIVIVEGKKTTYPTNIDGNFLIFSSCNPHMVSPVCARSKIPENPWKYVTKDKKGSLVNIPMGGTSGEYVLKIKLDVWIRHPGSGFDLDDIEYEDYYDDEDTIKYKGYSSYMDACNGYDCDW